MLDPSGMYPKGFHPIKINRSRDFKGQPEHYGRTQRPPRYYLIDFGLSCQYSSRDVLDEPIRGGDKSAPEHKLGRLCNPFYTDIYYLGNLIKERFLEVMLFEVGSKLVAWLIGSFRGTVASSSWRN